MKKFLVIFLSVVLLFAFAACGVESQIDESSSQGTTNTETENSDREIYYTVSFDTDGGTVIESQTIKKGEKAEKPQEPTKKSGNNTIYTFAGWYVGENEYDFGSAVNGDITIKAKWDTEPWSDFVIPKK